MKSNIIQIIILILGIYLLYRLYINYNNPVQFIDITATSNPKISENISKKSISKKKKTAKNKHEKECRRILESIFKKSFHSVRPDFLEYSNGHNLELDMYNEELKLAAEYQGIQHYKFNKFFHKSYDDFINLVNRDTWKAKRCKELGIKLITIPYTVKFENLQPYILQQLNK